MSNNKDLIEQFELISEDINYALEDSPYIADIDDDEFTEQDLQRMIDANKILYQAVKHRQTRIGEIADEVRAHRRR